MPIRRDLSQKQDPNEPDLGFFAGGSPTGQPTSPPPTDPFALSPNPAVGPPEVQAIKDEQGAPPNRPVGQGSESPMERLSPRGGTQGNQFAPPTPSYPTPQAGASMAATSGAGATSTFEPLPGVSPAGMTSVRRSLYGKAGGLLGGGLGVSSQGAASDPISALIRILGGR